jgi:hypothetical protein
MSGMFGSSNMTCPYLLGSAEGAICRVEEKLVRDLVNADIWFCLGRQYEACSIYLGSLIMMAEKQFTLCKTVVMDENCEKGLKETP